MRPRSSFIAILVVCTLGWEGFTETLYGVILAESLLDLLALPFALTFLTSAGADGRACHLQDYKPSAASLSLIHSPFGFTTAAGTIGSLMVVWYMQIYLGREIETRRRRSGPRSETDCDSCCEVMLHNITKEKKQILPLIISMGAFVSNWVVWGGECQCSVQKPYLVLNTNVYLGI